MSDGDPKETNSLPEHVLARQVRLRSIAIGADTEPAGRSNMSRLMPPRGRWFTRLRCQRGCVASTLRHSGIPARRKASRYISIIHGG